MQTVDLGKIGRCIYCNTTQNPLCDEHVIPRGLGGHWILHQATCNKCASITSRFEHDVLRTMLLANRAVLDLPTREPKKRPDKYPLVVKRKGQEKEEIIYISAKECPFPLFLPIYGPPSYMEGQTSVKWIVLKGIWNSQDKVDLPTLNDFKEVKFQTMWKYLSFERMLAKIGYGFAVAEYGIDDIQEVFIIPTILGQKDDAGLWIGCGNKSLMFGKDLHMKKAYIQNNILIYRIKLFSIYDTPEYIVVVGRLNRYSGE